MADDDCGHESMSGVDRDDTAAKVWRCEECGRLLRGTTVDGITVYAEVHVSPEPDETSN